MDKTLPGLGAVTAITSDDLLYMVDNPGGSPVDAKITFANFQASLNLAKSNVFNAMMNEPPAVDYASLTFRNAHPVLQFVDGASQKIAIFRGRVPRTAVLSQGCTVYVQWAAVPIAGTGGWDVSFERIADSGLDIDADDWGAAQTITAVTVPGSSGVTLVTTAAFTQAQLPASLALGDQYRIRIRRDVANDTAAGDLQLLQVEVRWA